MSIITLRALRKSEHCPREQAALLRPPYAIIQIVSTVTGDATTITYKDWDEGDVSPIILDGMETWSHTWPWPLEVEPGIKLQSWLDEQGPVAKDELEDRIEDFWHILFEGENHE